MWLWLRYFLIIALSGVVLYFVLQTDVAALKCPFELEASEQWTIQQERPGDFIAKHLKGRMQALAGVTTFRFDRYDVVNTELAPGIKEGSLVKVGDHVLTFHSLYDESQKKMLQAKVDMYQATLDNLLSGELQERVTEGEKLVSLAYTNYYSYLPLVERRRELYNTGYISNDEVQQAEEELNSRFAEISVAEADLNARKMACSSNVINTARAELRVAQKELEMVNDRLEARTVTTPVNGRVTQVSLDPEIKTILRVVNEDPIYARVVAPLNFSNEIQPGLEAVLSFHNEDLTVTGKVESVSIVPVPLMGLSVVHALIPIRDVPFSAISSMTGEAIIPSIKIDPYHSSLAALRSLYQKFNNSLRKE
ncbi:hypothetical protein IKW72_07420 [bacterium]|nr:hypothetical protein [bacterium]